MNLHCKKKKKEEKIATMKQLTCFIVGFQVSGA